MNLATRWIFPLLLGMSLLWGATLAHAAQMIATATEGAHLRSGPSTRYKVQWELSRGFPLQVIGNKSGWYKVRDFEGDTGWIARSVTNRQAHHVAKVEGLNIRSGPGTSYRVLAKARYGEILRTLGRQGNWVKVKLGKVTGWTSKRYLWGW
ncbi:SH3 domain-containing protein [Variovorax dokdonensis]|uniref:SH3 domain-containing protein n=1 Tax=Variovorax dokdonensis TaxID=344883 RepID=A0ABT7N8F5_9BURK|nr:SH3 domain-containing protein [Variovorax dokdonensis]MDM0044202.1 SH3 domain-containing protein [Variovorax dokdonensis]